MPSKISTIAHLRVLLFGLKKVSSRAFFDRRLSDCGGAIYRLGPTWAAL